MAFGPRSEFSTGKFNVDVPQIKDEYSDEETSDLEEKEKPMTLNELRLRTEKVLLQ